MGLGARSLWAMWWRRLGVRLMLGACAGIWGRGFPITWFLRRLLSLIGFLSRRTGSLHGQLCLRLRFGGGVFGCRARRARKFCAVYLRRYWGLRGSGLTTIFLRLVATASSRSSWLAERSRRVW